MYLHRSVAFWGQRTFSLWIELGLVRTVLFLNLTSTSFDFFRRRPSKVEPIVFTKPPHFTQKQDQRVFSECLLCARHWRRWRMNKVRSWGILSFVFQNKINTVVMCAAPILLHAVQARCGGDFWKNVLGVIILCQSKSGLGSSWGSLLRVCVYPSTPLDS